MYTGSFTPTALATYCPTQLAVEVVYTDGETTTTGTVTTALAVTSTSYEPATWTHYYYDTTTTITSPALSYTYTNAVSTTTYETSCTSTSYTAAATGTTTTQAAKCAPTNLITSISGVQNANHLEWITSLPANDPANKDASSCCQACVEDDECVAMSYIGGTGGGYGCELLRGSECGNSSIQVNLGVSNWAVQAGCGSVLLI